MLDFVGIGTPKSGTTWLAKCLSEHPEINFSTKKELNFFNTWFPFYVKKAPSNCGKEIEWLERQFTPSSKKRKQGTFSTNTFFDPEAPERIHKYNPNIKLIIILRNPAERLYSHYLHAKVNHELPSFNDVIKNQQTFVKSNLYAYHMKRYLRYFDKTQILTLIYADISKNPKKIIENVYAFLGVDPTFIPPSLNKHVNTTGPKFARKKILQIKQAMEQYAFGKRIITIAKHTGIWVPMRRLILKATGKNVYSPIPRKDREYLNRIYATDIAQLEGMLGRDLSFWRK